MIKCVSCNASHGAWYCIECVMKMKSAIVEHSGEDGRAFRGLHRLAPDALEILLKFDWRELIKTGQVASEHLDVHGKLSFSEDLGTLVVDGCCVCWDMPFLAVSRRWIVIR